MVESRNVFSGNPVIPGKRGNLSTQDLENLVTSGPPQSNVGAKVLPVYNGKPLVTASLGPDGQSPNWQLGWIPLDTLVGNVDIALGSVAESAVSRETFNFNSLVYLGEKDGTVFLCLDVSPPPSPATGTERRSSSVQSQLSKEAAQKFSRLFPDPVSFVELRTLMVATPWSDDAALAELSIAGHASTMAEWHRHSQFCENCGSPTQAIEAGQRRQCTGLACKAKAYPRLNPVVIMLVIDKERDRVVMGRQSRLPARMWSCLAGFIELGESLEEAVRRETREEVGIEVGEVVYHSSQPWPVGAPGMPCQLMIGFVGVAKTFDIHADNRELEDAQWFSRDQIRKALTFNEHKKAQLLSAIRVYEACTGEASSNQKDPFADFRVEWSGEEGTTMFVPGPFAIAHKLIVDWVEQGAEVLLNKL